MLHLGGVPLKSLEVLLSTASSLDAVKLIILSATHVSEHGHDSSHAGIEN